MGRLGPSKTVSLDSLRDDSEDLGHREILQESEGESEEVKQPDFRLFPLERDDLRLPSDFFSLTEKLFSLREEDGSRFFEASASYMFALQNMVLYPTVSFVSFCISIESLLDTSKPQYCEYRGADCDYKREAGKKFKQFLRDHIPNPPDTSIENEYGAQLVSTRNYLIWLNRFMKRIYRKRARPIHHGLLWKLRGPSLSPSRPSRENDYLRMLCNIALIDWLIRK